jgi:ADP-ribose pyrophosphatase YjhB (NUDIX family)
VQEVGVGGDDGQVVRLEPWTGPVDPDDPDANLKHDVAAYSLADPLATLERLGTAVDLPVGALARYVLARWTTGGSEALLELGPSTVERMATVVAEGRAGGGAADRAAAFDVLAQMVDWVRAGLDDPAGTYPAGGAGPRRRVRIGVYCVAATDDEVLLVRIAPGWPRAGRWTLPGGGLHHGEDVLDGLAREFEEETGLVPSHPRLLDAMSTHLPPNERFPDEDMHHVQLLYAVDADRDGELHHERDESTDAARWVPRQELDELPLVALAARARTLLWPGAGPPAPDGTGVS